MQQRKTSNSTTPTKELTSSNNSNPVATPKNVLWGSRSVDIFEKVEQIGEGTYGKVYLAKSKENGDKVALKKIRMDNEKEGFPITAIREIKILKELRHPNIVQLKEIVTSKGTSENKGESSIYMVFEYMDHDLTGLMLMSDSNPWTPTPAHIKCYMKQLLQGLHHCHTKGVLHRDIKGSNILLNNKGQLKLADFGLARPFSEHVNNYTNRVITLWYRPPELLLGAVQYGTAIDMWSVGCILVELLAKRAVFPGRNEIEQLELIYKICGTPTEESWPDIVNLPLYKTFKPQSVYRRVLREQFKTFTPEALDLIEKLLTLDPKKRISASEALDSEYFWTAPLPCDPSEIPAYPTSHEFQAKKRRAQQSSDDSMKRQRMGGNNPLPGSGSSNNQPMSNNKNVPPNNPNKYTSQPGPFAQNSGNNFNNNSSYNNRNNNNNNYQRPPNQANSQQNRAPVNNNNNQNRPPRNGPPAGNTR